MMKHAGLLNRRDALLWCHWWNVRGHQATAIYARRGLYDCYLTLAKRA